MGSNEPEPEKIDKDKLAVALKYDKKTDQAPVIAAKGKGYIAQQIIELAREHNIEIREDADLVTLLAKLDIDMPIPLEAYAAVAEILSYVYKANDKLKKKI
jgi:flagellar biosynthesis protein